ncbi:hypothetical protein D3C79_843480 [compost metagenome]
MGGLIGQGRAECPVGEGAGAKGLPEGLARVFGHDVLTVVAGDQHHYMAGALPALVAAMDFALLLLFTLFLLFTLGCHNALAPVLDGAPIIFLSTWLSYSPYGVLQSGAGSLFICRGKGRQVSLVEISIICRGKKRHWLKPAASRRASARST